MKKSKIIKQPRLIDELYKHYQENRKSFENFAKNNNLNYIKLNDFKELLSKYEINIKYNTLLEVFFSNILYLKDLIQPYFVDKPELNNEELCEILIFIADVNNNIFLKNNFFIKYISKYVKNYLDTLTMFEYAKKESFNVFNSDIFKKTFKKVLKTYYTGFRTDITGTVVESLMVETLDKLGYTNKDFFYNSGSHSIGYDLYFNRLLNFSIKGFTYEKTYDVINNMNNSEMNISSFRLSKYDDIFAMEDHIDSVNNNLTHYMFLARYSDGINITFELYFVDSEFFNDAKLWKESKNSWLCECEKYNYKIQKKMSNQLWIFIVHDQIKQYKKIDTTLLISSKNSKFELIYNTIEDDN